MTQYRKKPVVVEAVQWTSDDAREVREFCQTLFDMVPFPRAILIPTPEGMMTAKRGDWIIKGVNGEYYPCKPDVFAKTYEAV